ncbi:MAG: Uma2 family endonuclease [Armatimonadota bacterium]|nr:Uma2 family endonuclease [Armatimonadota bacterium]
MAHFVPDASWVRRERWEALTRREQTGFVPLCPDVAFEVAWPSDRLPDLRRKCRDYLANGAQLAVLIDPEHMTVEIHSPGRDVQVFESSRFVPLAPVLPGFTLDLEPIAE